MRHLDLFSGIGGFALAARWLGWETVGFCEIDPYCRQVLKKHWPGVPIFEDIRDLNLVAIQQRGIAEVHLVTGGFPCQPFSEAGKQLGVKDDRHLWPEMLRVIRDIRPTWIVGENVNGFVNMALDLVLSDLEKTGYSCWTTVIPACAAGAPHQRDRVWVVAHSNSKRLQGRTQIGNGATQREKAAKQPARLSEAEIWGIPFSGSFGMANGISNRMDRVHALGNAVVPQVAYQVLRAIAQADQCPPTA